MFQSKYMTGDDPLDGEELNSKPHNKEDKRQRRRHDRKGRRIHDRAELNRSIGEDALFVSALDSSR